MAGNQEAGVETGGLNKRAILGFASGPGASPADDWYGAIAAIKNGSELNTAVGPPSGLTATVQ